MCSSSHKVSIFGFCNPHFHKTLREIFDSFLILVYPHPYINSQGSVHLVQHNLLNMGILFQYMPCHKNQSGLAPMYGMVSSRTNPHSEIMQPWW